MDTFSGVSILSQRSSRVVIWRLLAGVISSLFLSNSLLGWQTQDKTSPMNVPLFSAKADTIYQDRDKAKTAISPDGRKKVSICMLDENAEDFPAKIMVDTEQGRLEATIRFGLDTEILWSPDSHAFAITGSSGGANGQYECDVFYIRDRKLIKIELTALVERAFGHPVKCSWSEQPNVAAVRWLTPSRELLVAAEIMHHSNCDSFGTFKAYAVDLKTHSIFILKVVNQLDAKRHYRDDLGQELLQADDDCIRHPESCHINH
jgi:hypothetical protein